MVGGTWPDSVGRQAALGWPVDAASKPCVPHRATHSAVARFALGGPTIPALCISETHALCSWCETRAVTGGREAHRSGHQELTSIAGQRKLSIEAGTDTWHSKNICVD